MPETDNKKSFEALLTNISKAVDCISHDLLISNLNANKFNMSAFRIVHNYFKTHMQRTKTNSEYSSWEEAIFGFPQESTLGPLLFYLILCSLFLTMDNINITSYADDNTPYRTEIQLTNFFKN